VILGLDVSSTISGICVLDDGELEYSDILDTRNRKKYPHTNDLATEFNDLMIELNKKYEITDIYIEERLLGFARGRTSTKTIVKLSEVNAVYTLICEQIFGVRPEKIRAVTARKKVGIDTKGFSGKDSKQHVLDVVESSVSGFSYNLTRYGNPKPGSHDRADAYVIARAGELLCEENSKS